MGALINMGSKFGVDRCTLREVMEVKLGKNLGVKVNKGQKGSGN